MPLLWVSLAFLVGLITGRAIDRSWLTWTIAAAFALVAALFDRFLSARFRTWERLSSSMKVAPAVVLIFFALGGLRIQLLETHSWKADELAFYNNGGEFQVTGWVSADPDRREEMTVYQVSVIEIMDPSNPNWQQSTIKVHGKAQVRMPAGSDWNYGDLLQFYARPAAPFEAQDFSYRDYLAQFDIHTVIYYPQHTQKLGSGYGNLFRKALIEFRGNARKVIFKIFPQPESGLLTGILLGVDNDLPESLAQAYRDTGVAHIIAISGFNMAVLAGLFLFIFSRLVGPYLGSALTLAVLALYTAFVEASPAVLRAMIMAFVAAGGRLIGRRSEGANALFFTAALMCLINPLLVSDVSFQLSFMATFGLVIFAQPMQEQLESALEKHTSEKMAARLARPLSEYFLFTLAAQFATLPVIAARFGRISVSSLLANPLVLPFQPAVLVTGAITTLAGFVSIPLGKVLMLFSWPFLKYTDFVVQQLAKMKAGAMTLHPVFSSGLIVFFGGFIMLFLLRDRLKRFSQSKWFVWVVFGLLAAGFSVSAIMLNSPDNRLHLHLLRCGEEGSLYLKTPSGKAWLINPHGNVDELTARLENNLSPWDFHLDGVLLTEEDASSELLDGLAGDISIGRVLLAPAAYRFEGRKSALTIPEGIDIEKLVSAETVVLEPGLSITLLVEDSQNTALFLSYGEMNVLIPNGVDFADIKAAIPSLLENLTVLILDRRDVSYVPPRVWGNLEPQGLLWNDRSVSPFPDSLGIDATSEIHLVSDGVHLWNNN